MLLWELIGKYSQACFGFVFCSICALCWQLCNWLVLDLRFMLISSFLVLSKSTHCFFLYLFSSNWRAGCPNLFQSLEVCCLFDTFYPKAVLVSVVASEILWIVMSLIEVHQNQEDSHILASKDGLQDGFSVWLILLVRAVRNPVTLPYLYLSSSVKLEP